MTTKTIIIRPDENGKVNIPISANLIREILRTEVKETDKKGA